MLNTQLTEFLIPTPLPPTLTPTLCFANKVIYGFSDF